MTQITEALEAARAHILDAYRIWQADDVSAVPPPKSGAGAVIAKIDAVLSSPGKDGGQEVEATQITMGRGLVDVSRIEHEGRAGILFRPRAEHIPVGDEGELQPGEYWPVKGDVVIWIENEGGARVIETYLSAFLPTQPASTALVEAAKGLKRIVEEIDGAMNHGTWRDDQGNRLKDTPEWVALYNALGEASK